MSAVQRRAGLSDAQAAVEPRSLGLIARMDGWAVGAEQPHARLPLSRRLTADERKAWRAGWAEGRCDLQALAADGLFGAVFVPGMTCPKVPA